ncbi:MAG: GTPase Era [Chloroflexota bacterium]
MQEYDSDEFSEYLDLESFEEEELPDDYRSGYVAVVGRPNVGKSTLMNAFLRQKVAIVSPRPQTTRTRQMGILTTGEYQMIFIDTPGIMQPRHKLDEYMLGSALQALKESDVILWLVDGSQSPGPDDREIAGRLRQVAEETRIILGINKADLLDPGEVLPRTDAYRALLPEAEEWILFSATEGSGRDELFEMLVASLPEGPRYFPADQVTDAYVRDIAAEMIREQILLKIREEIPYGVAVRIEEFKERDNGVIYINATIYVERESHKKIVIGSRGSQLREIGAAARKEIERLVGTRVYLDLWVKDAPGWRKDEGALRRFGYTE